MKSSARVSRPRRGSTEGLRTLGRPSKRRCGSVGDRPQRRAVVRHMDLQLKDKIALVTGASGGIGAATAQVLAEEGADVVVGYHKS